MKLEENKVLEYSLSVDEEISLDNDFENYSSDCVSDVFVSRYYSEDLFKKNFNIKIKDYKIIIEEKLNISLRNTFKDEVLSLFNDLLTIFKKSEEKYFEKLYNELPYKDPKYLAGALILILFGSMEISIYLTKLAKALNLSSGVFKMKSFVTRYLRSIYQHNNIKPIKERYKFNQYTFYEEMQNGLIKIKNDLNYNNEFIEEIMKLFNRSLNLIDRKSTKLKISEFYSSLPKHNPKNPHFVASVYFYIYLRYFMDVKIQQKTFIEQMNRIFDFSFTKGSFSKIYLLILKKYFIFQIDCYRNRVINYIIKFSNKIENSNLFNSEIPIYMTDSAIKLFDKALNRGYEVYGKLFYSNYVFPQFIALSLIYFSLKKIKNFENLSRKNLMEIIGGNWRYSAVTTSESPIYPYIQDEISRLKNRMYSTKEFTKILLNNLSLDTKLLLNLFIISKLSPQDFASKLGIYDGTVAGLKKFIIRRSGFSTPKVFNRIESFIFDYIDVSFQSKLHQELKILLNLKAKDFYHRSIKYKLCWNDKNCKRKLNLRLGNLINSYIENLYSENIKIDSLFNNQDNPRCSDLRLRGSKDEPLKKQLVEPFIRTLIYQKKLRLFRNNHELSLLVKEIFEKYLHKGVGINHDLVLPYILLNHDDSIAIELPIFKNLSYNRCLVGHIDLIQVRNNKLIILDYKPSCEPMITSLPQVISYGLIIKDYFKLASNEVLCISFNEKEVWEYYPSEMIYEVIDFLKNLNLSRKFPIDLSWVSYFLK